MKHPRSDQPTTCTKCGETKPAAAFNVNPQKLNGLQSNCRACSHAGASTWPSKQRARWHHIMSRYGLSEPAYKDMLAGQNGVCAICAEVPAGDLVVDHDHSSGAVRGLLCRQCNAGIGQLKDSAELVERAAHYLRERA